MKSNANKTTKKWMRVAIGVLALAAFAETVSGLIASEDALELLPDCERLRAGAGCGGDDEEMAVRTIFPFVMRRAGRRLSPAEAATIYRALNEDVSALLPATVSLRERRIASQRAKFVDGPDRGDAAVIDDGHAVAEALRDLHDVRGHHDRAPGARYRA